MSHVVTGDNAQPNSSHAGRMYFFDNLRGFIILMVIVFHAAIGYMTIPPEWWYVIDIKKNPLFDLFVMATDVFIMPIIFFIAGYFALPVLIKKGTASFWHSKFFRIVVPWIVGVLLFAPLITYSIPFSRTATPPSYLFFWVIFFGPTIFNHAQYWFLGVLTWFFLLLTIIYNIVPSSFQRKSSPSSPSITDFFLFGLVTALTFFVANLYYQVDQWVSAAYLAHIQPTRILLYLCYFGLGIHAWRNLWFTETGYQPATKPCLFWSVLTLIIFLAYRVVFTDTTPAVLKVGHALVHSFFCLAATFGFIVLFRDFFNSNAYLWRRLSANSYIIYYIHHFVLLPLAYMVQKIEAPVWVKFISVSLLSVILCYLIAEYIIGRTIDIIRKKPAQLMHPNS